MNNTQIQQTKKIVTKNKSNKNYVTWAGEFKLPLSIDVEMFNMTAREVVEDLCNGLSFSYTITGDSFSRDTRDITICTEGGEHVPYAFKVLKEVYGDYFTILNSL